MIKKGYQIHIETWENDADAINTNIVSGLSKNDVKYFVDLAKYFYKGSSNSNKNITPKELFNILNLCKEKHPNVNDNIKENFFIKENPLELAEKEFNELMEDYYYESLCQWLLLYPYNIDCLDGNMFCRAVNDVKVFYVPEDIEEVTDSFIEK